MVAVGTDIVRIARLQRNAETLGDTFLRRSFTDRELEICAGRAESLAGRWAAKEAVMKALGAGIGEVALTDIEIDRGDSGRPAVRLSGTAAARAGSWGLTHWDVSISHDGEYAIAVAVASE
jgi:holo-[acyl-carrier protein] synthase